MSRISLRMFRMLDMCLLVALFAIASALALGPAITSPSKVGAALSAPFPNVVGTVAHETAHRARALRTGTSTRNTSQALMIQLLDTSAPAGTLAVLRQRVVHVAGGLAPYHFTIDYDHDDTKPEATYAVRATLAMDGRILLESPIEPVLLQTNAPTRVMLVLRAVDLPGLVEMPAGVERLARFSY